MKKVIDIDFNKHQVNQYQHRACYYKTAARRKFECASHVGLYILGIKRDWEGNIIGIVGE
jgi:hypothetical protein